jgi:hypothetical protein
MPKYRRFGALSHEIPTCHISKQRLYLFPRGDGQAHQLSVYPASINDLVNWPDTVFSKMARRRIEPGMTR